MPLLYWCELGACDVIFSSCLGYDKLVAVCQGFFKIRECLSFAFNFFPERIFSALCNFYIYYMVLNVNRVYKLGILVVVYADVSRCCGCYCKIPCNVPCYCLASVCCCLPQGFEDYVTLE